MPYALKMDNRSPLRDCYKSEMVSRYSFPNQFFKHSNMSHIISRTCRWTFSTLLSITALLYAACSLAQSCDTRSLLPIDGLDYRGYSLTSYKFTYEGWYG